MRSQMHWFISPSEKNLVPYCCDYLTGCIPDSPFDHILVPRCLHSGGNYRGFIMLCELNHRSIQIRLIFVRLQDCGSKDCPALISAEPFKEFQSMNYTAHPSEHVHRTEGFSIEIAAVRKCRYKQVAGNSLLSQSIAKKN